MHNPANRRIRTRMSGGVGGGRREASPYPDLVLLRASLSVFDEAPDHRHGAFARIGHHAMPPIGKAFELHEVRAAAISAWLAIG
jgi:hypothetical protein